MIKTFLKCFVFLILLLGLSFIIGTIMGYVLFLLSGLIGNILTIVIMVVFFSIIGAFVFVLIEIYEKTNR